MGRTEKSIKRKRNSDNSNKCAKPNCFKQIQSFLRKKKKKFFKLLLSFAVIKLALSLQCTIFENNCHPKKYPTDWFFFGPLGKKVECISEELIL